MDDVSSSIPDRLRNTVQNRSCIDGMAEFPSDTVDLIIADPPYNLSKGADWSWENEVDLQGFGGEWNKTMEHWDDMGLQEYAHFTQSWLSEASRVLKPTGSIWTFGSYHNIGIVNVIYQKLGIEIINEVIWFKRNAFPNLSGRRFTASHETLLWGHVGGPDDRRYTFNYELMKAKEFPEDNINDEDKQVRTVWDIPNNKSSEELQFGKHPTQKPLRVLERLVLSSSNEGDLCLAPFSGAGSECVSAKLNNRDYLGFEVEEEYVDLSQKRLEQAEEKPEQLQNSPPKNQGTLEQYD